MQDLVQDHASLARKLLARFACFLQDCFYWEMTRQCARITLASLVNVSHHKHKQKPQKVA